VRLGEDYADSVSNFTCLLSKTDVHPVIKNVTSQHGWVVIVQAPLKKSLGEMLKIHDRAVEKLFKVKNVTAVAILTHRLIVGTSNATDAGGRRPDPAAVERIKKAVKEIDPGVEVEVIYSELAQSTALGGDAITFEVDTGLVKNEQFPCTLGYVGWVCGDTSRQVLVTAWHCIAFAGTDKTSPFTIAAYGPEGQYFKLSSGDLRLDYAMASYSWQRSWFGDLELHVSSDAVAVGVKDQNFFSRNGIIPGYVWYVYKSQTPIILPVVQQLGKYDVGIFSVLTTTKGTRMVLRDYANAVGHGIVLSTCWSVRYDGLKQCLGLVPVTYCNVITTPVGTEEGDSGSPVHQLVRDPGGAPIGVMAYGVPSGGGVVGIGPFTIQVVDYVAPLDDLLTRVDVKR